MNDISNVKKSRITVSGIALMALSPLIVAATVLYTIARNYGRGFNYYYEQININNLAIVTVLFLLGLFTYLKKSWIRPIGKALAWIWILSSIIKSFYLFLFFYQDPGAGMDWKGVIGSFLAAGFAALLLLVYQGNTMEKAFAALSDKPAWTKNYSDLVIILLVYLVRNELWMFYDFIRLPFESYLLMRKAVILAISILNIIAIISLLKKNRTGFVLVLIAEVLILADSIMPYVYNTMILGRTLETRFPLSARYVLPYLGYALSPILVMGFTIHLMTRKDLFPDQE